MSGQLVTWDRPWVGQTRRTPMEIQLVWPSFADRPALAAAGRVAAGAAIGGLFGLTTLYLAMWIAIGIGVGAAVNRIMSSRR